MGDFLQTVKERVVIYDGAMGTSIHLHNPSLDDYWGKENCSEVLSLSRPDIIREIHASFLEIGCDVIETNTFGGTGIVLREFDLKDRTRRSTSRQRNSPRKWRNSSRPKTNRDLLPDLWGLQRSCHP